MQSNSGDLANPAAKAQPRRPTIRHSRRLRSSLLVFSAAIALVGLIWGVQFAIKGEWPIVATDALAILIAGITARLTVKGKTRQASLVLTVSLFTALCVASAVQDIPSERAPRAIHHFLLVLGVSAFLLFKEENAWLSRGIPLACFVAFFGFASTPWGWMTPYRLPDEVRVSGGWILNGIALAVMYALLHIMQSDMTEHNAMESDLRKAMPGNQLLLHYQPQLGADGQISGAEALIRWQHPQNGMISPAEFIPVAEQTGIILPMGHWVLGAACAQLVAWQKQPEMAGLTLAVNVSAQQFRQVDYVTQVLSVLERVGANPNRLKLELTESMLVNDMEDIIAKMTALKQQGVRLSLDDFGTGYSSLSYLKRLPLHQLKIDKSFVDDVITNPSDAAIARTVVDLARNMGLDVIAEGVETQAQRQFLADIGCLAFQGYLLSRPLPIAEFDAFVIAHTRI